MPETYGVFISCESTPRRISKKVSRKSYSFHYLKERHFNGSDLSAVWSLRGLFLDTEHPDQDCNLLSDRNLLFSRLFLQHQKNIYTFILSMLHNAHDADDVMQDTLKVMLRRFEEFDPQSSFLAWGIAIARNVSRDLLKQRSNRATIFTAETQELIESLSLSRHDILSDRLDDLSKCVQMLPEQHRYLLNLRYTQCMKIKDIATHVGRPLQGVYKMFGRIHSRLRDCINSKRLSFRSSV